MEKSEERQSIEKVGDKVKCLLSSLFPLFCSPPLLLYPFIPLFLPPSLRSSFPFFLELALRSCIEESIIKNLHFIFPITGENYVLHMFSTRYSVKQNNRMLQIAHTWTWSMHNSCRKWWQAWRLISNSKRVFRRERFQPIFFEGKRSPHGKVTHSVNVLICLHK